MKTIKIIMEQKIKTPKTHLDFLKRRLIRDYKKRDILAGKTDDNEFEIEEFEGILMDGGFTRKMLDELIGSK